MLHASVLHRTASCRPSINHAPMPNVKRALVVARVAQVDVAGSAAAAADAAPVANAAAAPTQTERSQQPGQQGSRQSRPQRRPSKWISGGRQGDRADGLIVNSYAVSESTNAGGLSKAIRLGEVFAAGAKDPTLRLVCRGQASVPKAIRSVAIANNTLAEQGADYRFQVSSSVARKYGSSLYQTLQGDYTAFLFVSKVAISAIPSLPTDAPVSRVSKSTVWEKLAGYLQVIVQQGDPQTTKVVSCIGNGLLINAYKALILARYNIVRGSTANSGAPAKEEDTATTAPAAAADAPKDFAFVPTLLDEQPDGNNLIKTAVRMQLVPCAPPTASATAEQRLATPRPSRAASPAPAPRTAPTAPRPRTPKPSATSSESTQTVSMEDFNKLKDELAQAVQQHKQLMDVIGKMREVAGPQGPAASS